jgi:hypothetical protein
VVDVREDRSTEPGSAVATDGVDVAAVEHERRIRFHENIRAMRRARTAEKPLTS